MNEPDDPVARANEALRTAIGTQEAELRQRLGDGGYEVWLDRHNRSEEATIAHTVNHNAESGARSAYILAKAGFWRAGAFGITAAALLGAGWSIWEWVR